MVYFVFTIKNFSSEMTSEEKAISRFESWNSERYLVGRSISGSSALIGGGMLITLATPTDSRICERTYVKVKEEE